jgi:hypothetical protein
MTGSDRTLSDAELDLIAGGVRDNPWQDATNRQIAAQNSADGTLGGSLNNVIVGLVPPMGSGNPYSPGHLFDWP